MADRVYPSSKPTANGAANPAPNTTTANGVNPTSAAPTKPPLRQPYRPQAQYHHRRHRRSNRNLCCCCCFWSILIILGIALLAAIAGAAVYVLYRPHRPEFTVTSLRIAKLNLTTSSDASTSHLNSLFHLAITSKNPNSHFTFFYNDFAVTCSTSDDVQIANGSIPAFFSDKKNETAFRVAMLASQGLDVDSVNSLRSDLKKKSGIPLKIELYTKVKVKMGGLNSKKVGIRVTCDGIKGTPPKGKSPSVASVSDSKCKVDLRIKIWKWTF
ncbi:NDR1/HIN1-like protein 13 [Ziziphus jujuba]|uniref:NDR1/HIN1-like protein 13 n=2 Tax=Ziziphus jujuba TaxID=326968 RepID=A0A6P4A8E8_ZIZJJ|nr:NDR1/HIN1-like protein 13 [Ziziphus jujuba]KAH7523818.1 hypothetical protein FEM48_Zijuj06G0052300 [Ziziphus jujuba var. spinosa]